MCRAVAFLLMIAIYPAISYAQALDSRPGVSVRGTTSGSTLRRETNGEVTGEFRVRLEFVNTSTERVILVRPGEDGYWIGGKAFFQTQEDAHQWRKAIQRINAWPSNYAGPEFRELAQRLDKPSPPKDLTVVLNPRESWHYEMSIKFFFYKHQVEDIVSPLWLRLSLEVWPNNVANFKKNLDGKLQRRWRKEGALWVGETRNLSLSRVSTEPIALELNLADLK